MIRKGHQTGETRKIRRIRICSSWNGWNTTSVSKRDMKQGGRFEPIVIYMELWGPKKWAKIKWVTGVKWNWSTTLCRYTDQESSRKLDSVHQVERHFSTCALPNLHDHLDPRETVRTPRYNTTVTAESCESQSCGLQKSNTNENWRKDVGH